MKLITPKMSLYSTLGSYFFFYILQEKLITRLLLLTIIFEHHLVSGNIVHDLTDHLPKFLIINKFSHLPTKTKIFKLDYSHFNKSALVDEISSYSPRFSWYECFIYLILFKTVLHCREICRIKKKAAEERNQIYVRLNHGLSLPSRYLWT